MLRLRSRAASPRVGVAGSCRFLLVLSSLALSTGGWSLVPSNSVGAAEPAASSQRVQFNRDIRPILSDNCFSCHGPDRNRREAGLRLDQRDGAIAVREGRAAIAPGKAQASELVKRIQHADAEERMPPASSGKQLSERQKELLVRWIEQGAEYEQHWSLIPPQRPAPPQLDGAAEAWVVNPIDRFIAARLKSAGLTHSPDADKRTLVRRLYFDLLGLPPSPEEVDTFLADNSPNAYERLVDRVLASKHYGERMAVYWLDVVRYADTAGYHSDNHRDLAPYRDYVINAFNNNKPFDQFTAEQLAGDLMPNATGEQRTASGYNRLLQTTEEGGAQAKEYTAKYAADRVRNTSVIWLGLTLGCCECHDHKFDPFTMRDFYSLQAMFADVSEKAVGRQDQTRIPSAEQEAALASLDKTIADLQETLGRATPELAADQAKWETELRRDLASQRTAWTPLKPEKLESAGRQTLTTLDDLSVLASGENPAKDTYVVALRTTLPRVTGVRLETLVHESLANRGLSRANGNFVLTEVEIEVTPTPGAPARKLKIAGAEADFAQNSHPVSLAIDGNNGTGWAVDGHVKPADHRAVFTLTEPLTLDPAAVITVRLKHDSQYDRHNIGRFRLSLTHVDKPSLSESGLPADVADALKLDDAARNDAQRQLLAKHYRSIAPRLAATRQELGDKQKAREALVNSFPLTLVTTAGAPRMVRILPRGNWLDESGEVMTPATPATLNPLGVSDRRPTRLDLARWMTAPENPLTARVFANRLWKLTFGQGIVRTVEDFGTQGEWPSHPELMDWLAVEFRDSGWNVKHLHKLMVMSRTYRQTSEGATKAPLRDADPNNRLLARQLRHRIDAEFVRDNALAISGLLVRKVGGPSVKPYQPAGYWANLNFPTREWQNDHGDDLYRRGVYTYWCRSFLHPGMAAFDAPSREECVAERPRSNTPLQALVLLNDPTYVEAARVLAARALRDGGSTDSSRITLLFRQALQRAPREAEIKLLESLVAKHRGNYAADKAAVDELLKTGEHPVPQDVDRTELAAWTSAARAVLNLHETITRY